MDDINHKILSLGWSFEPHLKGTIIGQTAFNIYRNICNGQDQPLNMDEIHMKLLTIEDYNDIRNGCLNHSSHVSLKKISNCKLELRWSISTKEMKYFLYEPSYGQIDHYTSLPSLRSRLSFSQSLYVENILDVEINVLLEPLLSLRDCKSINEALMNWSLNKIFFYEEGYIDHESLNKLNMVEFDLENLKEKIGWFLTNKNIQDFVPKKFINKVKKILKAKGSKLFKFAEFLEVITTINKYFVIKVKKCHKSYHQSLDDQICTFFDSRPFELYGVKEEFLLNHKRKSLFLVRKNMDDLHLKSFAILFNLRWFFNTRYNSKKALGFDGEYGRAALGYGQTFHKYDDVILWLTTHPNTTEEVEFVVLDPIPPNYIF